MILPMQHLERAASASTSRFSIVPRSRSRVMASAGDHDHRHREHHAHQAGHDVVLRDRLGVVVRVDAQLDRAGRAGQERERALEVVVRARCRAACGASRRRCRWRRDRWRRPRRARRAGRRAAGRGVKFSGMLTTNCTSPRASSVVRLRPRWPPRGRSRSSRCSASRAAACGRAGRGRRGGRRWAGACGSELIAKPKSTSCMSGMPSIMPKVRRSRRIWMNSFTTIAQKRASENRGSAAHGAKLSSRVFHQVDEDVLEAGLDLAATRSGCVAERAMARSSAAASSPLTCSRLPKATACSTPGCSRSCSASASRSGPVTDQVVRRASRDDLGDGAVGEQLAVGDVGEPMAALGLVHVVRGDEEGQALGRRAGGSPPRNRGAPWGRRRRSARRAAAAAARESGRRRARAAASSRRRAGRRVGAARPARPSRSMLSRTACAAVRHAVHARDEVEVLRDAQVLVEAEPLRHVADVALDRVALA